MDRPYISSKRRDSRINLFAAGEYISPSFLYAGIFYNEDREYMENVAKYFNLLIRGEAERARRELENMLTTVGYRIGGRAVYEKSAVLGKKRLFPVFDGSNGLSFKRIGGKKGREWRIRVRELRVRSPSDIDKVGGLAFLRVRNLEADEIDRELEWQIRETILHEWIRLADNGEVKKYLEEVREAYDIIREIFITGHCVQPISKLAFYLLPIELSLFNKAVIISKASLYERRKPVGELWDELMAKFDECKILDDLEFLLREHNKDLSYLRKLLERAMSKDMLDLLRDDWTKFVKKIVKGGSGKIGGVFVGKVEEEQEAPSLSYGEYIVPAKPLRITVYAETGFELDGRGAGEVVESLRKAVEDFLERGRLGAIRAEVEMSDKPLESLFCDANCIKIIRGDAGDLPEIKRKDAISLLHGLSCFAKELLRLAEDVKDERKSELDAIILLLNTELEENEGRYPLWPAVKFIYNYYGIPVQTVTKRALRALMDKDTSIRDAVLKNLFISLYKDSKVLRFRASGFRLPQRATIYAVVERTSPAFFYDRSKPGEKEGRSHGLYEIYRIDVENAGDEALVTVRVEDKVIEIYGTERALALEEWLRGKLNEKESRFCFITPHRGSRLHEIYDYVLSAADRSRSLVVVYRELKTAYFPQGRESDCYIIYTQEVEKLLEGLGIKLSDEDKKSAVLAVKPAHPKSMEGYEIYHPALQLFFAERVGWERDEVYSEKKSLFMLTILALSMFESESFITPYSKLDLQAKEKNYYLSILRDQKDFKVPLKPVLYEMLGYLETVPGRAEGQ